MNSNKIISLCVICKFLFCGALAAASMHIHSKTLIEMDPWKSLAVEDMYDISRGDIAILREMRKMEVGFSKNALELSSLLDEFLVKSGQAPRWSFASDLSQIKWFGAPISVHEKSYRLGVGIISVNRRSPTRLIDKEYAKSWVLTMRGDGEVKFGPRQVKIEALAIFNKEQSLNKIHEVDISKYLRNRGFSVKENCANSGTQHQIRSLSLEKSGRSLNLIYGHTWGTGQESLSYTVNWGTVEFECTDLSFL